MKKIASLILIGAISVVSLFAREKFSISVGGMAKYDFQDDVNFGAQMEIKKNAFIFDFDLGFNRLSKIKSVSDFNMTFGAYFGGIPWQNKNWYTFILGGFDYGLNPASVKNFMHITPLARLGFGYTFDFGLDLRFAFDLGKRINFYSSMENKPVEFKVGLTVSYSFDLWHTPKPYKDKYNEIYNDNMQQSRLNLDKSEEEIRYFDKVEKQIEQGDNLTDILLDYKNKIESLEESNAALKEQVKKESIRYVAIDKDKEPQDAKSLLDSQRQDNKESLQDGSNFKGVIAQYLYDDSKTFDVFLSPLNITDIILEKGESVVDILLGNPMSWLAEQKQTTDSSEDGLITHVFLRPQSNNLQTDCLIMTDRRVYYLNLYSTQDKWMTALRFVYKEPSTSSKFGFYGSSLNSVDEINRKVSDLIFNYKISGTGTYKPKRVYSDGERTYIQFENDFYTSSITPSIYLKDRDGSLQVVNFLIKGITISIPMILQNGQAFVLNTQGQDIYIEREI